MESKILKIQNQQYRQRSFSLVDASSDPTMFKGRAVVFDSWSDDLGGFKEIIQPGAWNGVDVSRALAVFNHKEDNLLGSYEAGTLRIDSKEDGVYVEIDKADTTISRDCSEWVARGDVKGMSFKFQVSPEGEKWRFNETENVYECTITKISRVLDISLVTRAAYGETNVKMRGVDLDEIKKGLEPEVLVEEEKEIRKRQYKYLKIKNRR